MTPSIVITNLLPVMKQIWLPLLNVAGKKNEYRIIISSSNYMEIRILWGMVNFEKGEKKEFVIRGTEQYMTSIISSLENKKLNVRVIN